LEARPPPPLHSGQKSPVWQNYSKASKLKKIISEILSRGLLDMWDGLRMVFAEIANILQKIIKYLCGTGNALLIYMYYR
jgi:hypothetical protein